MFPIIDQLSNAEKTRIGMLGVSRGAITNFLSLKDTERVKAQITIGGIADLNQIDRPDMTQLYQRLIPNFDNNPKKALDDRSALLAIPLIKNKDLKNFIIHSDNDERVNVRNALLLYDRLKTNKFSTKLLIYENDNHGINNHTNNLVSEIINFFNAYL